MLLSMVKRKIGNNRIGAGIIGLFGRNFDLVYIRGRTSEFDLNDLRPSGKIFGVLCCDGALHLDLPSTKFTLRY